MLMNNYVTRAVRAREKQEKMMIKPLKIHDRICPSKSFTLKIGGKCCFSAAAQSHVQLI